LSRRSLSVALETVFAPLSRDDFFLEFGNAELPLSSSL
jgi:hypothetical protein